MPIEADVGKPVRFIILTNGRSGSNFLVNILNQHPQIVNYGEMLGEWTLPHKLFKRLRWLTGWDWPAFINWMLSSRIAHTVGQLRSSHAHRGRGKLRPTKPFADIAAAGFKDFFFLIARNDLGAFVKNGAFKIIYLRRDDYLARAVSLQRMSASGLAVQHQVNVKQPIMIDTKLLLLDLDAMATEMAFEMKLISQLDNANRFEIDYRDYFFDPLRMDITNQDLFRFLGVKPHVVQAEHRKMSGDSLASDIANLSEVIHALRASAHASAAESLQQ
jgi:hypothetical protein